MDKAVAPKAKLSFRERLRKAWHVTVVMGWVFLGAAVGWGIGSIQGRLAMQEARRGFDEEKAQLAAKAQQAAVTERALLARRGIHQALVALEQRNFGTAEEIARQAGEQLSSLGEGWEDYAEMAQLLSEFRPTVSDDVSEQRRQLMELSRRFDQLWDQNNPK